MKAFGHFVFAKDLHSKIPDLPLLFVDGSSTHLYEVFDKEEAKLFIFVPMFTSCGDICPMMIRRLKQVYAELKDKNHHETKIILFDFDAKDTPEQMKSFSHSLPADFLLIRAKDPARDFLSQLGYDLMDLKGSYAHKATGFALGKTGAIFATIAMDLFTKEDVFALYDFAQLYERNSSLARFVHFISHPEHLAEAGFVLLILLITGLFVFIFRSKVAVS